MTITKIFCDICNKEVNSFAELENIILDTKSGTTRRYEICFDCYMSIVNYILTKQKDIEDPNCGKCKHIRHCGYPFEGHVCNYELEE